MKKAFEQSRLVFVGLRNALRLQEEQKELVSKSGTLISEKSEFPEKTKGGFETMIKNLKKVISTLAAVAILATSAAVSAVSFPDVDDSASYAGAVDALTTLGIVNGDDNGLFNPENTVTRAEFAKMVVEALGAGREAASSTYTKFDDAKGHWAAGYIETGVAKEFINGYDEKTFGPDDKVTYAQAVKMLVAAIGYDSYASKQGGWPSGYLAYGSQLDIIAGVTDVTNETPLTRAQCAVLVYNTLKAPICIVNGYYQEYDGNGLAWIPNYEEQDGEDGTTFKSLLTEKHNSYVVKGRVMSTDKKKGTVDFKVEASDNFDKIYVRDNNAWDISGEISVAITPWNDVEMYVGTTPAMDMPFVYAEAITQKDKYTGECTLVSITSYGVAKTVEFDVTDIATGGIAAGKIEVKKENSNRTTTYKLNTASGTEAELYVNGDKVVGASSADDFATTKGTNVGAMALASTNMRGTVTLVDATGLGSAGDGVYDYVMVSYYDVARVTDVKVKSEEVTVMTDIAGTKINWSLVDEDTNSVIFYKDDAVIEYEDVKEDDVILVQRAVVADYDTSATAPNDGTIAKFDTSDWYDVWVSDKAVTGTATGKSTTTGKEYLLVDDTKYEFNNASDLSDKGKTPLNAVYTLYLDAMGIVYDYDISEESKNIGIVVGMYTKAGDEAPTVRMINAAGEEVAYQAKTDADAGEISTAVGFGSASPKYKNFNKKDFTATTIAGAVIEYTLSGGKIVMKDANYTGTSDTTKNVVAALNAIDAVDYKASTSKLGGYTIDATATVILDFDAYLNADGNVAVFDAANLEDDGKYKAWVYDRNTKTGIHGLVILTQGTTSLRPTSALAVVTASGSTVDVDGTECQVLTVARNGEEDIEVLTNYLPVIPEGSVIMYTVGADGYVNYSTTAAQNKLHIIFTPSVATSTTSAYNVMMGGILGQTDFTAAAANTYIVDSGNDDAAGDDIYTLAGAALAVGGSNDAKVEIFYGPVYSASATVLEIFKGQTATTAGTSSINDTDAFTLSGANVYTYSYDAIAGEGVSVSVGGTVQRNSLYKNMFGSDTSKTNVNWADRGTQLVDPMIALVRVVDNDVTDVIYYVAE